MSVESKLQRMLDAYYEQGLPTDQTELFFLISGLERAEKVLELSGLISVFRFDELHKKAKRYAQMDKCVYLTQRYICQLNQYPFGTKTRNYKAWFHTMKEQLEKADLYEERIHEKAADMMQYFCFY